MVDAQIPEEADATAAALAQKLRADKTNFTSVTEPDASPYLQNDTPSSLSTRSRSPICSSAPSMRSRSSGNSSPTRPCAASSQPSTWSSKG